MRKLKLLMAVCALMVGSMTAWAQASFNHTYTEGAVVEAGGDFFLYNIGAKQFVTAGLNYGTRATVDNSGRVLTLSANGSGFNIYNTYVSLNNRTNAKAGYLTTNGYVDSGSSDAAWVFTPVSVDGYTNAYTIKNSDTQYLFFDVANTDPGCPVNVGNSSNNEYSYWLLIPKATREAAGDYSHYLINTQMNNAWEFKTWSGSTAWDDVSKIQPGGRVSNRCGEKYHAAVDIYQEIKETVANGRYRFYAQGFWRQDGSSSGPVLYANNDTQVLAGFNANGEGTVASMDGASDAFTAGKYVNSVETFVNNGSLKVGINITAADQWVIFDNFVLDYLGQCVMDYAVALPEGGAMEAGTWYYFDIAAAADNYAATATTLGDIICTTDGYTLTSATTGNMTLTAEDNNLAATRYYVKSSSANQLEIGVSSYSYAMGTPTFSITDGSYAKTLTDFNVTFGDSQTNDPAGVLALLNNSAKAILTKGGSNIAEGTLSADGNVLKATFSDVTLDLSSTYEISIAAGVFGYEGQVANEAVSVSFNTPVIADGIYYFFNTDTKKYLSRGNTWGTQAITDDYGLPAYINFGTDGTTKVQFFDNTKYLSDGGWLYADNGTGGNFYVEAVSGGYKLKDKNTGKYVALYNGIAVGDAVEGDNLQGTSNIWALETPAQYQAKDNATLLADAQAATAAAAAGLTGITTLAALESELAANYGETSVTITGAKAEKFQQNASGDGENGGALKENVYYSETVNGLKPGLYKLSVDAFQRAASNDAVCNASGARSLIYVFAGSAKTQLKSWMDYGSVDAYGSDYAYDGKHYPNNEASAYAALETGNYANDVYVYVADAGEGTGTLTFGIKNPQNAGNNALWSVYENFTLTLYEPKATASEKKALADAIDAAEGNILGFEENEYAPYNNVAAVEALAAAKAIDAETATGVAVVEATSALTSAVWTKNDAAIAEALYDGTLKLAPIQATAENVALPGWVAKSGNLRQTFNDAEQKPCLAGATDGVGLFVHPGTYVYGETTGYTMPLKANTVYVAEAKYCGWSGDSNKGFSLSIGGASKEFGANANDVTKADALKSVKLYFKTQEAGNYLLTVTVSGNTFMTDFSVRQSTDVETVTITSAGYATYCSENALDFSTTGLTVYTAAVVGDEVSFTELGDGIVPAGQGVLLKGDAKSYDVPVTVTNASLTNAFIGVNVASEEAAGIFVLMNGTKGVGFYKTKNAFTVGAHTAYLSAAVAPTRSFIGFDEEITGIKNLKTVEGQDVIFDLSGRRVLKAQKGLYIINGKKVVK